MGTVLLLAAVVGVAPADSLPRALTLEQALALAERNSPQLIQAAGQRRTSAAAVRGAYAAFLPSVSLSAGASRQIPSAGPRTRIVDGQVVTLSSEPWSYSAGLGANVVLFSGGSRLFDLSQARARDQATGSSEVAQRFAVALAVKQQFFDVLAARESGGAAQAQLDQAAQQLKASIAQLRAHAVTRSDSLRSAIQMVGARLAVLDARNALEVANADLARAVGSAEPVTADETEPVAAATLSADDVTIARLAAEGPAVAQAAAQLDAARAARRGAWASYLPSLSTSYSRSGNGSGADLLPSDGLSYSGSLRLSLSIPIFNQLQREEQVTAARVAEENAVAALRDARLAARAGAIQALGAFHVAEERVASQLATLDAATEDLRMQRQRYELGSSTLLDVLTSQTTLDQARRDLIRARYDQRVAKAQIEALVGRNL